MSKIAVHVYVLPQWSLFIYTYSVNRSYTLVLQYYMFQAYYNLGINSGDDGGENVPDPKVITA